MSAPGPRLDVHLCAPDTAIVFTTWTGDANGTHEAATLRLFGLRSASGADWVSAGRKVLPLNVPEQTQTNYPCYVLTLVADGTAVACVTEEGAIEPGKPTTVRWLEYSADPTGSTLLVASGYVGYVGVNFGIAHDGTFTVPR